MKVSSKYGDRKSLENVDNISNKKRKQMFFSTKSAVSKCLKRLMHCSIIHENRHIIFIWEMNVIHTNFPGGQSQR